mmetsp:Transcript_16594/g.29055  ORF Transcript_16594/g.29055 Transcript_16594/m.29055 type:complete len:232 (+) Transcript_16594:603-1298(+)
MLMESERIIHFETATCFQIQVSGQPRRKTEVHIAIIASHKDVFRIRDLQMHITSSSLKVYIALRTGYGQVAHARLDAGITISMDRLNRNIANTGANIGRFGVDATEINISILGHDANLIALDLAAGNISRLAAERRVSIDRGRRDISRVGLNINHGRLNTSGDNIRRICQDAALLAFERVMHKHKAILELQIKSEICRDHNANLDRRRMQHGAKRMMKKLGNRVRHLQLRW